MLSNPIRDLFELRILRITTRHSYKVSKKYDNKRSEVISSKINKFEHSLMMGA